MFFVFLGFGGIGSRLINTQVGVCWIPAGCLLNGYSVLVTEPEDGLEV